MAKIEYHNGQKINKVTFIEEVPCKKDRKAKFLCFCGEEFEAWIHSVKSNITKSCGCYRRFLMKERQTKHGHSKHPLYNTYNNMIERCYTTTNISYHEYGGIGVTVCNEWKNSFMEFYNWAIGNGWEEGLQIDKDIKGDGKIYSPNTCCFVTPRENSNKRKTSRFIEHDGVIKTMAQWADIKKIKSSTIHARLKTGWSVSRSLNTPVNR